MKRIIRLTESDLARIVKRVIREQEESTAMSPESYITIAGVAGREFSATNKSGGDVKFTVTPSQQRVKDNKGNLVVQPGKLALRIKMEGKPNTYGSMIYDCNTKTMGRSTGYAGDTYTDINISAAGRYSNFDDAMAKTFLTQTLYGGTYSNKGAVGEMITKYCSMV